MTKHFELLESNRKHIVTYSDVKIPAKELVEEALYKAWKTQPSKNNMMAYHVDVYGPDRKITKQYIWKLCNQNHIRTDKEYNEKGFSNVTLNAKTHPNPNYNHIRSSAYLFVFYPRLVTKANPFYTESIKRGEHVADEMIPNQITKLREHISVEVGIFAANLTNYLLSSNIDISYNVCFNRDIKRWQDYGFTWMNYAPVLMMSAGIAEVTRKEWLENTDDDWKQSYPDVKPELEEVICWKNNKALEN
jgi:hypothetical protein|tara:strand:+ start:6609 stop:7349 length:741 start_codon:yes stop_codon:yes gene_type:complete